VNIAILELVKNSYDEDATEVTITFENTKTQNGKIIIEDNGNGMTADDVERKWMTLGTPNKTDDPYSRKGRRKIGEKGIARFGLDGLGRHAFVESRVKGHAFASKLEIDWDRYQEPDALFEKIPNKLRAIPKKLKTHGLRLEITGLRERWSDDRMVGLRRDVDLLLPPVRKIEHFDVRIIAPEFPTYSGKVKASFLRNAIYFCSSRLERDGTIRFRMKSRHRQERRWNDRIPNLSCGPAEFTFYFYYRLKSEYDDPRDFDKVTKSLKLWAGIKLFRDQLKVKPYGDAGNDWIGLDKLRVNDPSVHPGNNQVFGYVKITKTDNPDLVDTVTREGLIQNAAYLDLLRYLRRSIEGFADARKTIEGKREKRRLQKQVHTARKPNRPDTEIVRDVLLDFSKSYPEVFYKRLEIEINDCYASNLPNAALVLSRKLVENLTYNILETKYPRQRPLWWNIDHNRPKDFGYLIEVLDLKKNEFVHDQRELLEKSLSLIKPFIGEANVKTHRVMEYLENKDQLGNLRIPEIVQVCTKLIDKLKTAK
jgi:hypothetical protein